MPFKMHKIIFFPEKKNKKKYMCLPYLKFSVPLPVNPETHLYFYLALSVSVYFDVCPQYETSYIMNHDILHVCLFQV